MAKKGFRRTVIGEEEYDTIYGEGYSDCLKDMVKNLRNLIENVNEHDLDALEYVEELIRVAEETLNEESETIN